MPIPKGIHPRGLSLTPVLFLMVNYCHAFPFLLPRDQGMAVNSADSVDPGIVAQPMNIESDDPNRARKSQAMIVLGVALASLALTIPMFVYIWIRRRRLHAMRAQSRKQQQTESKAELANGPMRKGSITSMVEMPLTAAKPVGGTRKQSVTFAQPLHISVKPIKAVEIMVKPKTAVPRDSSWKELKP